jgi:hypothetical protein
MNLFSETITMLSNITVISEEYSSQYIAKNPSLRPPPKTNQEECIIDETPITNKNDTVIGSNLNLKTIIKIIKIKHIFMDSILVKNIRGTNLCTVLMNKKINLSRRKKTCRIHLCKGGNPTFNIMVTTKSPSKVMMEAKLAKRKKDWISKYFKDTVSETETNSHDKTSMLMIIIIKTLTPLIINSIRKYLSNQRNLETYTTKACRGITLCPLPHSS